MKRNLASKGKLCKTMYLVLLLVFFTLSLNADHKKDFFKSPIDGPKYIFFFIGDGMSSTQIQATEAFLTTINGGSATNGTDLLKPENRLNMSKMPVAGMQTTFDAFALMTDSASASTAFTCGIKTKSGVIGMDSTLTSNVKSVAQLAREKGKKVGIITSVSLEHATPAAFYASVSNRGYMNNIATQMAEPVLSFLVAADWFHRPVLQEVAIQPITSGTFFKLMDILY